MEEDKLRDLFEGYDPDMDSGRIFIERLEHNLDSVELIHEQNARAVRRNKIAVFVASIAGLLTGLLFSSLLPYLEAFMSGLELKIKINTGIIEIADYYHVLTWIIIGGISVMVSLSTYDLILRTKRV